ncbi:heme exporter protein CcmD [Sneathiella sp.]|uniref:heme exporter protein CcmD n=1 Tax=Sneathiella sp. TaxID=1964365 RepID=UPI00356744A8
MNSVATFFNMGGYGYYVWPSFALSAIVLAALYFRSQRWLRSVERELNEAENRRDRMRSISRHKPDKGPT